MRTPTLVLVALSFCGGLLLHCDVGVPAWAVDEDPSPTPVQKSGSRLKAIVEVSDDGAVIPTGEWFDTELETRCVPAYASDGSRRCLPVVADGLPNSPRVYFFGADCAGEKQYLRFGQYVDTNDPFIAREGDSIEGRKTYLVFRRGPEADLPADGVSYLAFETDPVECRNPNDRPHRPPEARYFELGEEVNPEEFPLLTKTRL